jgi:hypothetical protein
MAKLILASLLFLFNVSTIYSQEDSGDYLYYEAMASYYENLVEQDSNNIKKQVRAEVKLLSKRDQNGSLSSYNRAMSSACNNVCSSPDLANWQYVGPPVIEIGNVQWNGFVEEVCTDPTMINTTDPAMNCLMGTPTGGIWKFDGTKWVNKTDVLGEYGLGITKIVRSQTDPSYLLASTGASHTGEYGNSLGMIESIDNGENWTGAPVPIPNFDPCNSFIQGVYPKYEIDGTPLSLALNHFIVVRNHGDPDLLWEWCAPVWRHVTPPGYIDIVSNTTRPDYNPHLEINDLSTTGNTLNLTTSSPYANSDAFLFHGTRTGGVCTSITWSDNSSALPGYSSGGNQKLELSDAKGNVIFARSKGNDNNKLYRSTDGGLSWTIRTSNIQGGPKLDMEYSPATGLVYIGETYMMVWDDTNSVLHRANGASQHADTRDFSILGINAAGKEVTGVANDGGVSFVTYDPASATPDINATGVFSHQPISGTSMPIQQVWGLGLTQSVSPDLATGNMHNNDMAMVGGTWCKFGAGDGADIEVNQVDNSTVFYAINPLIYKKSFNSICGTSPYGTFIGRTNQWQFSRPMELHPADQCALYYGNDRGTSNPSAAELIVYNDCVSSLSAKKSLTNVTGNSSGHFLTQIGAIGLSESNPATIYLGSHVYKGPYNSGLFLKSTNGGNNWMDLSSSLMTHGGTTKAMNDWMGWTSIGDIVVSPTDEDLVFLTFQGTQPEFRVAMSSDGGNSFVDYSQGLPELPANTITYHRNSKDRLFVGTDAGVYYRDNSMPSWECFSENLPLTWVTDLDINYCENMLYVSTHGRGVHKTPLNVFTPDERILEINSNQTWTDVQRIIYSDIVVKAGSTLNIVHSKMKIAEDVRIIVEPSAYLEVSGSELTSLCEGSCWAGIVVEGNSYVPQTFPAGGDQGHAYLLNSTLSNAKSALNANGDDGNGGVDWNENGGIIRANRTNFINNRRAVSFLGYESIVGSVAQANLSNFTDCNFTINDQYNPSCGSNEAFITMFAVDGVEVSGCSFTDARSGLTNASDHRKGIGTIEATFIVKPSIFTGNNCKFTNLSNGISAENVQDDNSFEIQVLDAEFYNNQTSIRFYDINNESRILRNYALIGHPTGTDSYGIVLHNSSGFQVEENICEKDIASFGGWTHGFDIFNTFNPGNLAGAPSFGHNVVRNNVSKDNSIGFKAWGVNESLGDGLEFLCNQNVDNNNADFWIFGDVKPTQGSNASPAGNTFSCGGTTPFDFGSTSNCFTYFQENTTPCSFDACITVQSTTSASSCNYISYISTATEEAQQVKKTVAIYPNPASESVVIKFESKKGGTSAIVEILNTQGRVVKSAVLDDIRRGTNDISLDISGLTEGMFIVLLKIDGDIAKGKLIKMDR